MQDFALVSRFGAIDVARDRQRFEDAFARLWAGEMESDGFNRLILGACLDWRQVTSGVFRARRSKGDAPPPGAQHSPPGALPR